MMQTRLVIHTSGKRMFIFFMSFLYSMAWYPPQYWKDVGWLNGIFWMIKIFIPLALLVLLFLKKTGWNIYYSFIFLTGISVLISGATNPESLMDTMKMVVRIIAIPLYIKMAMDSEYEIRVSAVCGMTFYLFFVCLINVVQIIFVGGQTFGHYFFLGSDNGIATTYFLSIFLLYIRKILLNIKHSVLLCFSVVNLIVYGLMLEVGSVKLYIIGGGILYALYRTLGRKEYQRLFCLRNLLTGYFLIWLFLLLGQFSVVQDLINRIFYEKFGSLLSRLGLWNYFLARSLQKPLFGYGAGLSKYRSMQEGFAKWTLMGNCHNCFIETIYHYGYVTFFLIVILLILLIYRYRKVRMEETVLGIFLFLFLLHGLVEGGIGYMFPYLPFLYYSDRLKPPVLEKK